MNRDELLQIIDEAYDTPSAVDEIIKRYGKRPMSAAPKDGSKIIAWAPDLEEWVICAWTETWLGSGARYQERWCIVHSIDYDDDSYRTVDNPTMWMPLPEKPE